MEPVTNATVYVVDDDADVRDALAWLLRSRRLYSESFASAEDFLKMVEERALPRQPQCLLLDVRMTGMTGLALFDLLKQRDGFIQTVPVIFLTGHADVPTAVQTVKQGAFDFCEKPFSDNVLVDRIEQALQQSAVYLEETAHRHALLSRLADLTEREKGVMKLVVEGVPNKLIADQLDISVRTVEVHRARVFDKMQVKSAVELANVLRAHGQLPSKKAASLPFCCLPQSLGSTAAMMPPPRHTSPSYSTADCPGVTAHWASGKSRRKWVLLASLPMMAGESGWR